MNNPKQTLHAVGEMEMLEKMENLKGQQDQKSLSENRLNTKTNTFRSSSCHFNRASNDKFKGEF